MRRGDSLRERVHEVLKNNILTGVLPPNTRVIEEKLAAEIGTSRTPVREAMQKLEKEGLVYKLLRGGRAINALTMEDVEEVFGIRCILEGYAAFLATSRATNDDIRSLETIVKREEEYLKDRDADQLMALNTEFHEHLYRAARSAKLYSIINDLRDHICRFRAMIFSHTEMAEIWTKDHSDMISLMKAKRAAQVEKLMRKHIIRGKNLVSKKLERDIKAYGKNSATR
jgi:DNA-binding GntR family transcriptional regulator